MMDDDQRKEERNFGEGLRHELNNSLTAILGNAELLLAELRGHNLQLPAQAESRLETIAALAVCMRETARRLSEEWQAQVAHVDTKPAVRASACR